MKIIELFQQGKKGAELCEDKYVVTPHFVAVIDGSTGKGNHDYGMPSGLLAATILKAEIESWQSPLITATEATERMTAAIARYYSEHAITDQVFRNGANRLTASVVIYSEARKEVWQIGDCQFLTDGKFHDNPKTIDRLACELRSVYLRLESLEGASDSSFAASDPGREFIMPLLRKQCILQNNPQAGDLAYGVIDGFPVQPNHIIITSVSSAREIVLSSDGYPRLLPTLQESEEYLHHVLQSDPLCYKEFLATKGLVAGQSSFDDRTYIRFSVNEK